METHFGYVAFLMVRGEKRYLCFRDGNEVIDLDRLRMLKRAASVPCEEADADSQPRLETLTVSIKDDGKMTYDGGKAHPRSVPAKVEVSYFEWRTLR